MMILVDSNVLLDSLTDDPQWREWSEEKLLAAIESDSIAINPVIYAELAAGYRTAEQLDRALRAWPLERLELPYDAAFPASQAFVRYRREGGARRSPLPDFYIGAHALTAGYALLTRDRSRYESYFPKLPLIG